MSDDRKIWDEFFDDIENPDVEPTMDFPGSRPPVPRRAKTQVEQVVVEDWHEGIKVRRYRLADGSTGEFYPIRALARALDRQVHTLRIWERKGWLPSSRFRSPPRVDRMAGARLYSKAFIERLQSIAEEEGVLVVGADVAATRFPSRAHALMEEIGQ